MRSAYLEDLGMTALVGRHVISALVNEDKNIVALSTTTGMLYLSWNGDCCAQCFLAHMSGADNLVDAIIVSVENAEWSPQPDRNEDWDTVVQTMGTNIKTTKGYVSFETRLEHNSYYSGSVSVSDEGPMDAYSGSRRVPDIMNILEDF